MKFCKDCKWVEKGKVWPWSKKEDLDEPRCLHNKAKIEEKIDEVTGKKIPSRQYFCSTMRSGLDDNCGPNGKLWEKAK